MAVKVTELEFADWIQAVSLAVFVIAGLQLATPHIVAIVAVFAFFGLLPSRFRAVGFVAFVGAIVVNGFVVYALLPTFTAQDSSLSPLVTKALLTGLTEPVTTKLLPAGFLLWYFEKRSPETAERLRDRPLLAGASLGFSFGLLEALLKVAAPTGPYGGVTAVTTLVFIVTGLHLFTGLLVAGAFFRWWSLDTESPYRQPILLGVKIGVPVSIAMGVHYWWNAGGRIIVRELLGFV